ncbi:bifunctional hydroxymethylpyrimidine kinase/phosphomethylpyrimidine kinase [Sphingomonas mali]|uniref:bifunctional hydroxymethylpyrimidine kinase/phosphomethylpyrimidine kinase n=1 Tax=Sphingomonas mali TaxID=40682 RepID=UPI00083048EA|nr:bifunctional hydroxymethylpyrimidine kinase/phosphomethylpyrimidine kinase [Sphingomonas mali]
MTPRVLIIAGSDSGGGAGIQADIKTVTMLGGHAMTAITAITAQNTLGVQAVLTVPTEMVIAQINSVVTDIGVDAVKIGMIGSAATAHAVADVLEHLSVPIVFDPVMVATSGSVLADDETIAAFERLGRIASLVTPNLVELAALCGLDASLPDDVREAATDYATRLGTPVLAKGGHGDGDQVIDWLIDGAGQWTRWRGDRIASDQTHGTGCTLASAIATYLARGCPWKSAIVRARQFVRIAIKDAPGLGSGHGPMGQQSVRLDLGSGARLNQVTVSTNDYTASCAFYATLGLKQIVDTDDAHYARFEAAGGATLSVEVGARPTVYFECENLDAEVERLENAGVTFDQPPTDQPWLWREARLTDPSGNPVCLYQAGENRRYPPWRLG